MEAVATTMQAVVLEREGGPEVLEVQQVPVPEPGPGEVRVRMRFASLNRLDVWIRKGMPRVPKPRVMGADGAGVVDAVGEGVEDAADLVGQRVLLDPCVVDGTCEYCRGGDTALCENFQVLGEHRAGTHAQYVVVPRANVHAIPAHLSDEQAAALPLVFATAWRMLFTRARLREGERVLVWGASAGVGTAAVQLSAAAGIESIATTRSEAKQAALRELGATHVVDSDAAAVVAVVKDVTEGRGVQVVFDHLGEVAWEPSFKAMAKGGRFVTCGATTGANPPALITRIFWKQLSVLGSTMASRTDFAAMLAFVAEHRIAPRVDRVFPLAQATAAHEYLESAGQVGKVLLAVE